MSQSLVIKQAHVSYERVDTLLRCWRSPALFLKLCLGRHQNDSARIVKQAVAYLDSLLSFARERLRGRFLWRISFSCLLPSEHAAGPMNDGRALMLEVLGADHAAES